MSLYRTVVRPLLFQLPPERAQEVGEVVLRQGMLWRAAAPLFWVASPHLATDLCGLKLRSPVGLAAGFDKDCRFLHSMACLGFGYLVGGTVVEHQQPGNPRPRMARRPRDEALVNALGFPSRGLEYAAAALGRRSATFADTPVVVSVAGTDVAQVVRCQRRLEPLAEAVEVNISSPNTAGLRVFHRPEVLAELLGRLNDGRRKPLFVKLPPYGRPGGPADPLLESGDAMLGLVRVCVQAGAEALTVGNSRPIREPRLAVGTGGLSGRPLLADTLRMVAEVRAEAGDKVAINACGGISTGDDAWAALKAGATTVQLYTALVYGGPGVVKEINRRLLAHMEGAP